MDKWTLADRVRWAMQQLRVGGLATVGGRIRGYLSPKARAVRRRYLAEAAHFDAINGYETCGVVSIADLTIDADRAGSHHYEGSATADIVTALSLLDLPIPETTFVDIGCGMARPLLIAAEQPFKRLIGIEFAEELLDIARKNFARRAAGRGSDPRVELICGDATLMPVPEGPVVFFFFNSFGPPALNRLLERIHASWRDNPRPIRFIYLNIQHLDLVHAAGFKANAVAPDYHFTIFEPGTQGGDYDDRK